MYFYNRHFKNKIWKNFSVSINLNFCISTIIIDLIYAHQLKIFNVNFYGKNNLYNGAFKVAMVSDHGNRKYVLN